MPVKSAFLAGVLAHVPEADRGKAETELIALEEGGLRQSDYSRLSAEAKAAQDAAAAAKAAADALLESNKQWFESRKAALTEVDGLRAKVTELETRGPLDAAGNPLVPADVIRKKDFDATLDTMERGAVAVIAESNRLSMEHYKTFGDVLDINAILSDKRVQQIGLKGVYQDLFKDQLKAKADAAVAAHEAQIRKDEREKTQAEYATRQLQYPVVGNEASSLDAIEAARTGSSPTLKSVDQMASEYARLNATRAGV